MKPLSLLLLIAAVAFAQAPAAHSLNEVRRVYIADLSGGAAADAMRAMLIASLNQTRLFVLTDNEKAADAILKGAADDRAFIQSLESDQTVSGHEDGGVGSAARGKSGGYYAGTSAAERDAVRLHDRKHEAYASVRLVNRNGDILWSTTQESQGAKFHSASNDVAEKVARQMLLDAQHSYRFAAR